MPREILWTDAEEIGIQLQEKFPDLDPLTVRFTDLHRYVTELEGFADDPAKSNESRSKPFRWPGTRSSGRAAYLVSNLALSQSSIPPIAPSKRAFKVLNSFFLPRHKIDAEHIEAHRRRSLLRQLPHVLPGQSRRCSLVRVDGDFGGSAMSWAVRVFTSMKHSIGPCHAIRSRSPGTLPEDQRRATTV
jgi:FeS assembly protein IscX